MLKHYNLNLQLSFLIIISLFISGIWLYYLKLIDVFENEKWQYIGFTFVAGTIIPNVIFLVHDYLYEPLGIGNSKDPLNSFIYFTLGVGLLEEFVKLIPVLLVLKIYRKAINEPLDYIKYASVSALGFAFGENVEYAWSYGGEVLFGRAVLSVPGHLFFSAIFIYGFVLHKYTLRPRNLILRFAAISILSHGLYDYLLDFDLLFFGRVLNIVFFLLLVSVYSTILNNALNNSPFYTPDKTVDQDKVRHNMFLLYGIALFAVFLFDFFAKNLYHSYGAAINFIIYYGFILSTIVVRLSRFSIIPQVWKPVKPEFPFAYKTRQSANDFRVLFGLFTVKGESYNDYHISRLFKEEVYVLPLSKGNSIINGAKFGIIEQKIFLNERPVFVVKIWLDKKNNVYKHFLLLAKTEGVTHNRNNEPIASLNSINSPHNTKLVFHEWVVLKKKT